jgi:ubiquinone/menaquinone biosynthesis C-methylase UbiE
MTTDIDPTTIAAYDHAAQTFAREWDAQPPPADLQAIIRRFFTAGRTADIGCGSGRDAAWLTANGFPTHGYDASASLLAEAARRHPHIRFTQSTLPELSEIADSTYTNVQTAPTPMCCAKPSSCTCRQHPSCHPSSGWSPS